MDTNFKIQLKEIFRNLLFRGFSTLLICLLNFYGYTQSPLLGFEENKGQITTNNKSDKDVFYRLNSEGSDIWITSKGLTYVFYGERTNSKNDSEKPNQNELSWTRVDMVLKNAKIEPSNTFAKDLLKNGNQSYYLGHCPEGIKNVKTYRKIEIKEIYPGIDWLLYFSEENQLKYDFIVHPGADPACIKLIYEGTGDFDISENAIHIQNALGSVNEGELLCYQNAQNKRKVIASKYSLKKNKSLTFASAKKVEFSAKKAAKISPGFFSREISFEFSNYDKEKALIIDPVLTWGTVYGAGQQDNLASSYIDNKGNLFQVGNTSNLSFFGLNHFPLDPSGSGYFEGVISSSSIGFILKFDNNGVRLNATYYGGSRFSSFWHVTGDDLDHIYITGSTGSTDFPIQSSPGAFIQTTKSDGEDIAILKFDNNLNREWATFYGGSENDAGICINVDVFGNIWVVGGTKSTNFPLQNLPGAYNQNTYAGITGLDSVFTTDMGDFFILKFNSLGTREWATFFGGTGPERATSVVSDSKGKIYIGGFSESNDFPTISMSGAYNNGVYSGGHATTFKGGDAIIAQFTNNGIQEWTTYLGGSDGETFSSLGLDSENNLYATGGTWSTNFPTVLFPGAFNQSIYGGGTVNDLTGDVFIAKFDLNRSLIWSTLQGGPDAEYSGYDNIAFDACDNLHTTFTTQSAKMNTINLGTGSCHVYQSTKNLGGDGFISKFSKNGVPLWLSYIGGSSYDGGINIELDNDNNLFFAGRNDGGFAGYPLLNPGRGAYHQTGPGGRIDLSIVKLEPTLKLMSTISNADDCGNCDGAISVEVTCGFPPFSYEWSTGLTVVNTTSTLEKISGLCTGDYFVIVTNDCNTKDTLHFTVQTVSGNNATTSLPIVNPVNDQIICAGDNFSIVPFTGSAGTNFEWTNTNTAIGLDMNGTNNISTFKGNAINTTQVATIEVTPVKGLCSGTPITFELTVIPQDNPSFVYPSNTICSQFASITPTITGTAGGNFTSSPAGLSINKISGEINPSTSNINDYTITYTTHGTCSRDSTISFAVISPPVINPLTNKITCASSNVSAINFTGTSKATFNWTNSNTKIGLGTSGIGNIPAFTTIESNTIEEATIEVTPTIGSCKGSPTHFNITLKPLDNASFKYSSLTICSSDTPVMPIIDGDNGGIFMSSPAGLDIESTTGKIVPTSSNSGTYKVTYTTNNNCPNDSTLTMIINAQPIVNAPKDQAICEEENFLPINFSGTGSNYNWTNTDTTIGLKSSGTGNIQSFTASGGNAEATIEVMPSLNSCIGKPQTFKLKVKPLPIVLFKSDILNGCVPLTINFSNLSPIAGNCFWDFGNGESSLIQDCSGATIKYNKEGAYDVALSLTNTEGCTSTKTTANYVNVYSRPKASFNMSPDKISSNKTAIKFKNTSTNATTYTWNFGDGSSSIEHSPLHKYKIDQEKYQIITLWARNTFCTDSIRNKIQIIEDLIFYIPNAFTPNGDGINQTFQPVFTSGFHPNDYQLLIFNRWGEKLFESSDLQNGWDGNHNGIPVQDGAYTWKIILADKANQIRQQRTGSVIVLK